MAPRADRKRDGIPIYIHRTAHDAGINRRDRPMRIQKRAVVNHKLPTGIDLARAEILQVIDDHQIGQPPRRNGPAIVQSKPLGRVERCHAQRGDRVQAKGNRLAHHIVDAALIE